MRETRAGLVMAPLILRGLAVFIDLAIVSVINLALAATLGDSKLDKATTLATLMAATAAYNLGFVIARSATPGKLAMNIFIGYPDGSAVRPDTAILRYLVLFSGNLAIVDPILFYALSALLIVNIGFVLFSPERRGIHDRIAGTIVLAGRPGAPLRIEDDVLGRGEPPRP